MAGWRMKTSTLISMFIRIADKYIEHWWLSWSRVHNQEVAENYIIYIVRKDNHQELGGLWKLGGNDICGEFWSGEKVEASHWKHNVDIWEKQGDE